MKNIFGTFTTEDDENEYEEALEKDLENKHRPSHYENPDINKNTIQSGDIFISKDITRAKKIHN